MGNGLEKAIAQIKKEGLPSADVMRAQLDEMRTQLDEERHNELPAFLKVRLSEHTGLFERFKSGEELTDAELKRMTDLSDEFQSLQERTRAQ